MHRQVYAKPFGSHLRRDLVSVLLQSEGNSLFEGTVHFPPSTLRQIKISCFCILQESLEHARTPALGLLNPYIGVDHAGENSASKLGASEENIQTALSSVLGNRAKVVTDVPIFVAPIANRNEYGVALVSLHVFQVFDEKTPLPWIPRRRHLTLETPCA